MSTWVSELFKSGAYNPRGNWNANTNTPTLASGVGDQGDVYYVNVAGTTTLDGISDWSVGDFAVFSGAVWQKWDNSDLVQSVDGKTGAVDGRSNQVVYFGIGGDDANDGKSYIQRKLTLAAAKTAAAALTPAAANIITIICVDSGIYSESYTSADYVNLDMRNAILTGNITVSHDMVIHLRDLRGNLTVDAGKILKTLIMEHSSGSVTNNGTIRGRIWKKLWGVSEVQFLA